MFPKPVRRILFWCILAFVGYYAFNLVTTHGRQEVIVYKQYASALMNGDVQAVRRIITDPQEGTEPFRYMEKRNQALARGDIRFDYFQIIDITEHNAGRTVIIEGKHIIRYDPEGINTLWGQDTIEVKQNITLVRIKDAYKVESFSDDYYQKGMTRPKSS